MIRTLALILAGGASPALSVLSAERAGAAVPMAGKYRVIDFTLSNCVNSNIYNVGVLTQYKPQSLHQHLGVGRPWDLDRAKGGLRVLHPFPTPEGGGWQRGTADAIRYNLDFIADQPVDHVLILASDHIYKMDYRPLLQMHQERGADLTLATHSISPYEAYRYGVVAVDNHNNVVNFVEKPRRPDSSLASMGVYVFRKELLVDLLANSNDISFGRDMLPRLIHQVHTFSYHFQGYWVDVGTVQSYYEANMALLTETPALDLYDFEWIIHTVSSQRPGGEIAQDARIENSLLSDGSRIRGEVARSIISPGASIAPGAVVRDSIILHDAVIESGAVIDHCIIDEDVHVGRDALVGDGDDNTPNHAAPEWLNTGLTLVGTRARIPANARLGRNVVVQPRTPEAAFAESPVLASGTTLGG